MLSFLSWCTCKITVLFLRMKRCIDRSVGAYFLVHPVYKMRWEMLYHQRCSFLAEFSSGRTFARHLPKLSTNVGWHVFDSQCISDAAKSWNTCCVICVSVCSPRVPRKRCGEYFFQNKLNSGETSFSVMLLWFIILKNKLFASFHV